MSYVAAHKGTAGELFLHICLLSSEGCNRRPYSGPFAEENRQAFFSTSALGS
jgi:hypothetical protein